eukprot:TRINITY_DN1065_c0_g2_i1.p1 TRINITY_DN1065_c0_g2~~TRINITY_DN1065_c0_g2_i1.p1  ORF type:complete len:385 (+),score=118.98 TRINITY_DN1065_c0_g2_i1:133-1155(+)
MVSLMTANTAVMKAVEWDVVVRSLALLRAGTPTASKRDLYAQLGSWDAVQKHLHTTTANHSLQCFVCRRMPIDGPLFSCLSCYGVDTVWCQECDATSAAWHPAEHVKLRWPKGHSPSTVFSHKGTFRYRKLLWRAQRGIPESTVTCSECQMEMDHLVVRCVTCPSHPVLCPKCGIGNRDALQETAQGRVMENVVCAAEAALSKKLYTKSDKPSRHAGHSLLLYPHMAGDERVEGAPHQCTCDVCNKALIDGSKKRYRCAICHDYDRCEACLDIKPHKHPLMVIAYPEQRLRVSHDTTAGILGFVAMQADNASSGSSDDEEAEEVEEGEEDGFLYSVDSFF